ncbi:hemicentin-1 [Strongylocentrotus purpuratus]|uniref:Properdin n=1 Tax=Strongylocentrotus purpuratus TaxID=7668 RepID=A0A7M7G0I1_STRPU|nr:hemicentin-1 [Strongylocentrotus purpuratus]
MVIMERIKVSLSVVGVLLVCATSLASETPWSNWTECTQTCGYGVQFRHRPCPHGDHAECTVSELGELKRCKLRECPIDGGWSDWSRLRPCSKTCGEGGVRARYRTCTKPRPQHGGLPCEGSRMDRMPCSPLGACPVDGGWSDWTEWGACQAKVCRKRGNRFRTRRCNNPEPLYGGSHCEGASSESEKCKKADCPVHGGWSAWRDSTSCSTTCGIGNQIQTRTCDNPAPADSTTRSGKDCIGESSKTIQCRVPTACPFDGSDGSSSFESSFTTTTSTTPGEVAIDSEWSSVSSVADPDPGPELPKEKPNGGSWASVSDDDWVSDDWAETTTPATTPENEQLSSFEEPSVDPPANPGNEPSASSFDDSQVDGSTTPGNHGNGGDECDPASDPDASSFCP